MQHDAGFAVGLTKGSFVLACCTHTSMRLTKCMQAQQPLPHQHSPIMPHNALGMCCLRHAPPGQRYQHIL